MSIANTLIRAMEQAGISQTQLAEQVGVTQSYISQICAGKKVPTIATLTRIGGALGMPIQEFLKDEVPPEYLEPTPDEARILTLYRSMSERDQAVVCGIVEQLHTAQETRAPRRSRRRPSA